jgi:exopolysaccharide biosynthesis predicted pyruvyltransferase EpsI/nitroreductase
MVERKRILWIGCFGPEVRSIGDHAQTLAIERFLDKYFSDFEVTRFYRNEVEKFENEVKNGDWIFLNSSGDFGDLYPEWHQKRKEIIAKYPRNPIIQLPVSVHYEDWANFEKDKIFFSQRKNLLLLCRTMDDSEFLRGNFTGCQVKFFPDFAYNLSPPQTGIQERKGTLYVLRCDNESVLSGALSDQIPKLHPLFRVMGRILRKDLLRTKPYCFISEHARKIDYGLESSNYRHLNDEDVLCDVQSSTEDITDVNRERIILQALRFYGNFRLVVTDRFHAGVFASLMNTPVRMLPTRIKGKNRINLTDCSRYFKDFREIVEEFVAPQGSYDTVAVEATTKGNDVLTVIHDRRSTRKWNKTPVNNQIIKTILEAGAYAPSAANYQGTCFKVVSEEKKVADLCQNTSPWFIHSHPPLVILVFYDLKKTHEIKLDFKSWHNRFIWQDTACAMQNMMLAAESLGLKSCWASLNPQQQKKIHKLLNISNRFFLASMLFLGYSQQKVDAKSAVHQGQPIKKQIIII